MISFQSVLFVFAVSLFLISGSCAVISETKNAFDNTSPTKSCPDPAPINCTQDNFLNEVSANGGNASSTSDGYLLEWTDEGTTQSIMLMETTDMSLNMGFDVKQNVCTFCSSCASGDPEQPTCLDETSTLEINCYLEQLNLYGQRKLSWVSWLSSVCRAWRAAEWVVGSGFLATLPPCPCNITDASPPGWTPPSSGGIFHPGAANCVRSTGGPGFAAGQQCCYDAGGDLITGGRGAGTPDRIAPDDVPGTGGHFCVDVVPFFGCSCETYLSKRPPNNGNNCPPNVVSPC